MAAANARAPRARSTATDWRRASVVNERSWFIPLDEFLTRLEATPADKQSVITGTYSQGLAKHVYWLRLTRHAYNIGILFLLAGLTFVVIPKGTISDARYGVIALASVGFVLEAAWSSARSSS